MHPLGKLDHRFIWHPFTQMRDWLERQPIVIAAAKGAVLRDVHGREYLDANSSMWTNLHGHNHPKINLAIRRQLKNIAHSSALGLANGPAALLAEKLAEAANPEGYDSRQTLEPRGHRRGRKSRTVNRTLSKVFFSDDGSTAMEVALNLSGRMLATTGNATGNASANWSRNSRFRRKRGMPMPGLWSSR